MTKWKEEIRRCEYAPSILSSYRNCQAAETSINRPMYGKIVAFVEPMSSKCLKIQLDWTNNTIHFDGKIRNIS